MSGLFGGKPPVPRSRMPGMSTSAPAGAVTPAAPRVPSKFRSMGIAIGGPAGSTAPAFPSISSIVRARANAGASDASNPFPPIATPAPWEPPQSSGLTNAPASNGKSAELRSYDPSRRDRWARALIEWGVPEETVEGLIGSRGLGKTDKNFGLGLVDLTPAGIPLATDEAERARQVGNTTDAVLNMAGTFPIPGAKAGAKVVKEGIEGLKSLAARVDMIDPPPQPPRPFEADYPGRVDADETGRLRRDIGGREIRAPIVVGRQVRGGADVPLSREEYATIIRAITGRDIGRVPKSKFKNQPEGTVGGTWIDKAGRPVGVDILNSLDEDEYWKTVRHEFGHVIDLAAGKIPTAGLEGELRRIYGALQQIPDYPLMEVAPEVLNYPRGDVPRELIAEAIRAYAMDPNYIKAIAPETAKAIRRWVSASPQLSRTLHFNSIAVGLMAGAAAVGALPDDAKADER